jgi:hypothetical protein
MTADPALLARRLPPGAAAWRVAAKSVAVVSGCFCLLVGLDMMLAQARMVQADVLNDPALIDLRRQFSVDPDNESLKRNIRAADLRIRQAYFAHQERTRTGARLLLYGALALLASLIAIPLLRDAMPEIDGLENPPSEWARRRRAQRGLAAGVAAIALIAALAAWGLRSAPEREPVIPAGPSETLAAPSAPSPGLPSSATSPASSAHE